tara:strand:- start:220 stop:456 length:237 start_codon:yes stop_codon:yes gene_type:complete
MNDFIIWNNKKNKEQIVIEVLNNEMWDTIKDFNVSFNNRYSFKIDKHIHEYGETICGINVFIKAIAKFGFTKYGIANI